MLPNIHFLHTYNTPSARSSTTHEGVYKHLHTLEDSRTATGAQPRRTVPIHQLPRYSLLHAARSVVREIPTMHRSPGRARQVVVTE